MSFGFRTCWLLLVLGLLCSCGRQETPVTPPPVREATWRDALAALAPSGSYALASISAVPIDALPPSQLIASAMLQTHGGLRLHVAAWTSTTDRAAAPLAVYVAELPSPLHAYGLYCTVPAGADQTALRGGPSKRVKGTLVGMKDRHVFWTKSDPQGSQSWVANERLFLSVCRSLPGDWRLPAEVRSLGRMEPAPASIEFVKDNFLGIGVFGAALVARYPGKDVQVEAFVLAPASQRAGQAWLQGFRTWLADNGITAIQVEHGGTSALFVHDDRVGDLYLMLDIHGLRGVHGAKDVAVARSVLDQWQQLEAE